MQRLVTLESVLVALARATDGDGHVRRQFLAALDSMSNTAVRPSVLWFSSLMEQKLRKHDGDKEFAWDTQPLAQIEQHVQAELVELQYAMLRGGADAAILEAADVAACAHILADRLNGSPFGPRGKGV